MISFRETINLHQGNFVDKWDSNISVYDQVLPEIRSSTGTIVEVGVQNGGSLEIYCKYFHNIKKVIGIDIDENCKNISFEDEKKIELLIGDVKNLKDDVKTRTNGIDLFIDDGSHTSSDIIITFVNYFDEITDGGMYIIEDLHCSYFKDFGGGVFQTFSSMNFLRTLSDFVNMEHWIAQANNKNLLDRFLQFYKIECLPQSLNKIYSITFYNSMCVIRKGSVDNVNLGSRVITGNFETVTENAKTSPRRLPEMIPLEYTKKNNSFLIRKFINKIYIIFYKIFRFGN
jgi:cephalosporin hydroxylase